MPVSSEPQQVRRDNGPTTGKGEARKRELMDAARAVFERMGYFDARVSDIAREAKASHGTFYTYFDTKEAVFAALAHDVIDSMLAGLRRSTPTTDLDERVRDSIQRFIEVYRPNAKMIGLIEQVGTSSPEMLSLRLGVRDAFVQRTRRGIQRMMATGQADSNLDIEYTAEVLGAMLEFSCYLWFCLGKQFDEKRVVDALTATWIRTLTRHP